MTLDEIKTYKISNFIEASDNTLIGYLKNIRQKLKDARDTEVFFEENPNPVHFNEKAEYEHEKNDNDRDILLYTDFIEKIEHILYVRAEFLVNDDLDLSTDDIKAIRCGYMHDIDDLVNRVNELDHEKKEFEDSLGHDGLNRMIDDYNKGIDDNDYLDYLDMISERNGCANRINLLKSRLDVLAPKLEITSEKSK